MHRILVATDGSPGANRAVDAAARLAKVADCELLILTIGGSVTGEELRRLATIGGDLSKKLEAAANKILKQARMRAVRAGASKIRLQSGWGDPAEAIIDTIRHKKVDTLVVGRRGRGQLSGLLLGSVSQKLASLAPCIVIVVP
jgi:nucleotide-binding universal stress UspA family protein